MAFGGGHAPSLRGRFDQHHTRGCAEAMEIVVVGRSRCTAACTLASVNRIEIALFYDDVLPIHFQFLGDNHRQGGLDTLSNFGLLRDQSHNASRRNTDESVGREFTGCSHRFRGQSTYGRFEIEAQHEASSGESSEADKSAATELGNGGGKGLWSFVFSLSAGTWVP